MSHARYILLVEDDASNRLTMAALLEEAGFVVAEAETLASARASLAEGHAYEVVLLDRHLPDGNGVELISMIRSAHPSAYIIVLSGEIDGSALADLSLMKGADFDVVLDAIERKVLTTA